MKILHINTTLNTSATGRIAVQIGEISRKKGIEVYFSFSGRKSTNESFLNTLQIGSKLDFYIHAIISRIFDKHGFGSKRATNVFLNDIDNIKPDIIHLHNLHGYYINVEVLFNYLSCKKIPVVWSLHDCWSFTGHCSHFEYINCQKWQEKCFECPQKDQYPSSILMDNSENNYNQKKLLFNSLDNLTIVPVSNWLQSKLKNSFLGNFPSRVIHNGIDLEVFKPNFCNNTLNKFNPQGKVILLGVASKWSKKKGFYEFIKLSRLLDKKYLVILIGKTTHLNLKVPKNIKLISKTQNQQELAKLYSIANIFLNLSLEETYPTTNMESIACGTPVITYKTGGSPESVRDNDLCVKQGDLVTLLERINELSKKNEFQNLSISLRSIAKDKFDKDTNFVEYVSLYNRILEN